MICKVAAILYVIADDHFNHPIRVSVGISR